MHLRNRVIIFLQENNDLEKTGHYKESPAHIDCGGLGRLSRAAQAHTQMYIRTRAERHTGRKSVRNSTMQQNYDCSRTTKDWIFDKQNRVRLISNHVKCNLIYGPHVTVHVGSAKTKLHNPAFLFRCFERQRFLLSS